MQTQFSRNIIQVKPLAERINKLDFARIAIHPEQWPVELSPEAREDVEKTAEEIKAARAANAPVVLAFGAHSIKNGLTPVLVRLMKGGWVTHFATNGAGVIHDWEFAFQGRSGEDVHRYASEGQFGIWDETGKYINLSLLVGAFRRFGYGESVGTMIKESGIKIPDENELQSIIAAGGDPDVTPAELNWSAAAADLRMAKKQFGFKDGFLSIPHCCCENSLAWSAVNSGVPFTCHPMIGHDIIYTHPVSSAPAIGRTAQVDFLSYVNSISHLENGVYLSVGSAVMSPMIFEKALSMARNVARQQNKVIEHFTIHVLDLAASTWDWTKDGEPPMDNPAYYLRFCKTFSRMGGKMTYCSADNRSWLVALLNLLEKK